MADAAAPETQWCWATQVSDALVAMQKLVTEAVTAGTDTVDPEASATQIHRYRSAAQIGITQSTVRSDAVMCKHNALARRLLDRQHDYLRSPETGGYPPTTAAPNATSG